MARATETAAAARARSSLGQAANCVRQCTVRGVSSTRSVNMKFERMRESTVPCRYISRRRPHALTLHTVYTPLYYTSRTTDGSWRAPSTMYRDQRAITGQPIFIGRPTDVRPRSCWPRCCTRYFRNLLFPPPLSSVPQWGQSCGVRDSEIAQLLLERRHRYTDDRRVGWHARAPWRLRG